MYYFLPTDYLFLKVFILRSSSRHLVLSPNYCQSYFQSVHSTPSLYPFLQFRKYYYCSLFFKKFPYLHSQALFYLPESLAIFLYVQVLLLPVFQFPMALMLTSLSYHSDFPRNFHLFQYHLQMDYMLQP